MSAPEMPVLSVTEFNAMVNDVLANVRVWVKGEISGYKVSQNKWVTFDLKDAGSKINCFMTTYQLDMVLADGMEVKIFGNPRIYVPYGKYSFTVQRVEAVGEGALRRAFELTKAKLEQEGIFAIEHKKPIPRFPTTIGLVTSPEAAAYTDFLRILGNRWGGVEVICRPSLVQGNDAPEQLVAALEWFNRYQPVDVIVLTRGGGSLEDLMAFNSERVCRAVYASRIPIICGIGHERDTCLAEMAADVRASTPSNAAELAVPDRREILSQLQYMQKHMEQSLRLATKPFENAEQRLMLAFSKMQAHVQAFQERVAYAGRRLQQEIDSSVQAKQEQIGQRVQLLASFNPRQVLQRGYAIARDADGQVIRRLRDATIGGFMQTEVSDGVIGSEIRAKGKSIHKNGRLF